MYVLTVKKQKKTGIQLKQEETIMKKWKVFLTAAALMLSALPGAFSAARKAEAADTIKIMPVGDSITFGLGDTGGYRKFLDYFLKEKGYTNFEMVGPEGQNSASFNYNGKNVTYDDNHAGYSGFQIKQPASWGQDSSLYNKLKEKNAVKQAQPDIILLIIGTNDMTANRSMNDCANDLKDLVNYMLNDMPQGGKVFMGSIPEFTAYGGTDGRVTRYNNTVKQVADEFQSSGKNVEFADVHGCLNGTADLGMDGLHPNGTGYEKMGKFWAETIDAYLKSNVETTTTTTTTTTETTTTTTTTETTTTTTTTTTSETTTEATTEKLSELKGDVDCSGDVKIADAILLARYLAEDPVSVTSQGLRNAELDGNADKLTAEDLSTLLQVLAGLKKF